MCAMNNSLIKRVGILLLTLILALSTCGCSKKVKLKGSDVCAEFTVSGELNSSGKVKITGTLPGSTGQPVSVKNKTLNYTKSGNTVTLSRGNYSLTGVYNSSTNTFQLTGNSNYCALWKATNLLK